MIDYIREVPLYCIDVTPEIENNFEVQVVFGEFSFLQTVLRLNNSDTNFLNSHFIEPYVPLQQSAVLLGEFHHGQSCACGIAIGQALGISIKNEPEVVNH